MKTATITHPNDPRGATIGVIVKRLSRIEIIKRDIELEKMKQPTDVGSHDGTGRAKDENGKPIIEWRIPGSVNDPMRAAFWYQALQGVAVGWVNPPLVDEKPADFNDENLFLLFEEQFDIHNYEVPIGDGKTVTLERVSFPFYIMREYQRPETFGDPSPSSSAKP